MFYRACAKRFVAAPRSREAWPETSRPAPIAARKASNGRFGWASDATLLLIEILIFVAILLVAYVYAWGKGVFRWD